VLDLLGLWIWRRVVAFIIIHHLPRIDREVKLVDFIGLRLNILIDIESISIGFVQWLLNRFKELIEIGTLSFVVLQFNLEGHSDLVAKFDSVITVNKHECKILLTSKFWKFDINGHFKFFVGLHALLLQSERSIGLLGSIDQLQLHILRPCCFSCILKSAIDIVAGSCGPNDLSWLINSCRLVDVICWIKEWFKSKDFAKDAPEAKIV